VKHQQAAYNNARWCHTVCGAHGIPGEFQNHLWLNRRPVPRFYPNAVTLSGVEGLAEQQAALQTLIAEGTLDSLAVKDSFCALDLAPLGFHLLFEATWLWRAPTSPEPIAEMNGIQWASVQQPAELARWETAWNGLAEDSTATPARIFPASLLDDEDVVFSAAYQGRQIVAGAIANRTGEVVGLSNVFAPPGAPREAAHFWAGGVTAASWAFPGLPLVGYERGEELIIARQLGFEAVGPLRVWAWARSSK
jgi:hypothetical protein